MITLTLTYRIIWEGLTLNIQQEPDINYGTSLTMFNNPNDIMGYFESDDYQDIEDKINELGLRPPGHWLYPQGEDI